MKNIFFLSFLLLISAPAFSVCPAPTQNPQRSAKTTMEEIKDWISEKYEELAEIKEEERNDIKSGNQDCSKSPQNTEDQAIKIGVYEYLYENVINQSDEADNYLTPTLNYAQAREEVKSKLFQPPLDQLTEKGEKPGLKQFAQVTGAIGAAGSAIDSVQILIRRDDYSNAVASKNLKISTELREKILEDIKSVQKAETDGCNQLQGLVLENRNLGALVAETASDIIVQILTLESLAVRNLQKEDMLIIPVPTKPEKIKSGKASSASGAVSKK